MKPFSWLVGASRVWALAPAKVLRQAERPVRFSAQLRPPQGDVRAHAPAHAQNHRPPSNLAVCEPIAAQPTAGPIAQQDSGVGGISARGDSRSTGDQRQTVMQVVEVAWISDTRAGIRALVGDQLRWRLADIARPNNQVDQDLLEARIMSDPGEWLPK